MAIREKKEQDVFLELYHRGLEQMKQNREKAQLPG
jgi:hypothetical protein